MFELQPTEPATIAGPTVELKTLTVSGRKLTKTLFNQLIREDICDEETATLRGAGWGHVFFDNSHHELQRIIVWQKGDELRRCSVWRKNSDDPAFPRDVAVAPLFDLPQLFLTT